MEVAFDMVRRRRKRWERKCVVRFMVLWCGCGFGGMEFDRWYGIVEGDDCFALISLEPHFFRVGSVNTSIRSLGTKHD